MSKLLDWIEIYPIATYLIACFSIITIVSIGIFILETATVPSEQECIERFEEEGIQCLPNTLYTGGINPICGCRSNTGTSIVLYLSDT